MRPIVLAILAALPVAVFTQTPQFRSAVDLVHLDVSVLDNKRLPVRGLTQADFTILEDGQPRTVANFVAVDVPPPPPAPPPNTWMRTVPFDIQTNDVARAPDGRLIVLVLDDALIPRDASMIASTKRIGQQVIDRLSRGDRMAVVFTTNSRGAQTFTNDRARLTAAIETFTPGGATYMMGWDGATKNLEKPEPNNWEPGIDMDAGYRAGTVRTLEQLARSLAVAPERRKLIIFVSTGVLADMDSSSQIAIANDLSFRVANRDSNIALVQRMPALYRLMKATNVTLYTIDPAGFGVMEAYLLRSAQALPALQEARTPYGNAVDWYNPPGPPMASDLAKHSASVSLDFLRTAAANTGGFAVVDTNDFDGGVQRVFAENASYYLLGFALPADRRPGSVHRLEVKVKRPDVQVRTRSGYEVPEKPEPAPPATSQPAAADESKPAPPTPLLAAPIPMGTLPMRIAMTPLLSGADGKRDVAVMLWMDGIPGTASQSFDIELRAYTTEGVNKLSERRTGQTAEASTGSAAFEMLGRVALPPGRYEIRAAATLKPANLAGSVFGDIVVPEPVKNGLELSGVLLEARPAVRAGPLDVLKGLLPLVPTSRRDFLRGTAVKTYVRIHQAGTAPLQNVSVVVSIQDRKGVPIYNYPHHVAAARFDAATRSADFDFEIPFHALESGEHLLSFDARTGDHKATQRLRFSTQ